MRRRQAVGVVVVMGCLAVGGRAKAVDVDERPAGRVADAPGTPGEAEKHYIEIPFGRHAPQAGGASPTSAPAPPTKPPSTPEIDAALRELADPDFRKREAASARLEKMGAAALPALRYARETATDPEIASRADAAVRNIEHPPTRSVTPSSFTYRGVVPQQFGGDFQPLNRNLNLQLRQERGGRRKMEVREAGGRIVRIEEGPEGIRMSVTTPGNGDPVTREYQAATPEQLKSQDAAAFELYNRWSGRAGGAIRPPEFEQQRREFREAFEERMREMRRMEKEQRREIKRRRDAEQAVGVSPRDEGPAQEVLGLLDEIRQRRAGGGGGAEHAILAGELPGEDALDALLEDLQPHADQLLAEIKELERRAAANIRAADAAAAAHEPASTQ